MKATTTAILICALTASAGAALEREIEQIIPARDFETLRLKTGNGQVNVEPSPDDSVHLRIVFSPRRGGSGDGGGLRSWFVSSRLDREELLESIELRVKENGKQLTITPLPMGSTLHDRVNERWIVAAPARLRVEVDASSSEVDVRGIKGGVRLRQGHGGANIEVPEGDLDVVLEVGDVHATSGADEYASVDVEAQVGKTKVWLDDRRVRTSKPPGPGSFFKMDGGQGDTVDVRVTVGNATLRLGE